MPIYRIREAQERYGDLNQVIPQMVNEYGQVAAAKKLGISAATVNKWLKENGYRKKIQYVKEIENQ